ncbi:hypothetical protein GBAR_LOCUS8513 [Geodia barretti]|uniref:Uncharacterized protein n=1 Tax=Geodia barretti TaxID=519541 RepID=A0AA35WH34_GEOBA|nr:hypothetical protein GBAR_LOCUS8513 [Geodia barretti]
MPPRTSSLRNSSLMSSSPKNCRLQIPFRKPSRALSTTAVVSAIFAGVVPRPLPHPQADCVISVYSIKLRARLRILPITSRHIVKENHIRCTSVKGDEGSDRFVRGASCSLRFVERESVWTPRHQGSEPLPRSLAPQPSPQSRARERASRAAPLVQEADDGRLQQQILSATLQESTPSLQS